VSAERGATPAILVDLCQFSPATVTATIVIVVAISASFTVVIVVAVAPAASPSAFKSGIAEPDYREKDRGKQGQSDCEGCFFAKLLAQFDVYQVKEVNAHARNTSQKPSRLSLAANLAKNHQVVNGHNARPPGLARFGKDGPHSGKKRGSCQDINEIHDDIHASASSVV
jgi:hypothetical protein